MNLQNHSEIRRLPPLWCCIIPYQKITDISISLIHHPVSAVKHVIAPAGTGFLKNNKRSSSAYHQVYEFSTPYITTGARVTSMMHGVTFIVHSTASTMHDSSSMLQSSPSMMQSVTSTGAIHQVITTTAIYNWKSEIYELLKSIIMKNELSRSKLTRYNLESFCLNEAEL